MDCQNLVHADVDCTQQCIIKCSTVSGKSYSSHRPFGRSLIRCRW